MSYWTNVPINLTYTWKGHNTKLSWQEGQSDLLAKENKILIDKEKGELVKSSKLNKQGVGINGEEGGMEYS